ncbi:hypothetical protein ACGFIX_24495 [Nocardia salmonicida]|uniref:hypothetical protein n=1 Tax=Nocardia salmonicida TaxID=53431 RepID=UPI0037194757
MRRHLRALRQSWPRGEVTGAVRVADDIRASTGNDNVHLAQLDRASIDAFANSLRDKLFHIPGSVVLQSKWVATVSGVHRPARGIERSFGS